ncbi:MAG: hypothetical protein CML68_21555 [Rhodobacteraceae bacterium]|nr:hypothetical protein [Paracoccaceae bacterium]
MNLYTCFLDLKNEAKALNFAMALEAWMNHLQDKGAIAGWQLYRRKLNLASTTHRDFLLEIAVEDMTQLDKAFRMLGSQDDDIETLYRNVHEQIQAADFGLYRPFPDAERAERMALL